MIYRSVISGQDHICHMNYKYIIGFLGSLFFITSRVTPCAENKPHSNKNTKTPSASVASVDCNACFPIETLPARLRTKAITGLTILFDSEALYTAVGGVKPLSQEYDSLIFRQKLKYTENDVKDFEAIVNTWHCTDLLKAQLHRHRRGIQAGAVVSSILFFRSDLVASVLKMPSNLSTDFESTYNYLEYQVFGGPKRLQALRLYGELFGYPKYAIDFFVDAEKSKTFVEKDFFAIPSFGADRFLWTVPKKHKKNAEDILLESRTGPILEYYKRLRRSLAESNLVKSSPVVPNSAKSNPAINPAMSDPAMSNSAKSNPAINPATSDPTKSSPGKSNPENFLTLIRSWYSNGNNQCSPIFAEQKIR